MLSVFFKIGFYFNCFCFLLPLYRAFAGFWNGSEVSWYELLKSNLWTILIFGGINALAYYLYHRADSKITATVLVTFPLWAGIGLLCWYLLAFSGKN